jgi:glycerol-3-phosphate dehydrogenase (NAD(P)+)
VKRIAIIGGGGWGTALSIVLMRSSAQNGPHQIRLWVREEEICEQLRETRVNEVFLPGFKIPDTVQVTRELGEALADAEIVLGVMPSAHARNMYRAMLPCLSPDMVFVSATKGLEEESLSRMSQVIHDVVREKFSPRVAVLSGPTFAREMARGDPAAVVISSADHELMGMVQKEFSGPHFRLYRNADIVGVELGGSLKNIIAIAAGVCDGLGLGSNTIAALVTRGLAEMTRLSVTLGAQRETLAGLSGLGDLVLTCTGALSRNRTVGVELGKGRKLQEIIGSMRMVAEGVGTTVAAVRLAHKAGIEMPITEQMHSMLYQGRSPQEAIRELMERSLKHE